MYSTPQPNNVTVLREAHRVGRLLALTGVWRILLWTLATVVLVWAFTDQRFRDLEGLPTGRICLPIAASFTFIALSWAAEGRWRKFACWLSLLLIGQAAALQLIEAGNLIRYQHYRPVGPTLATLQVLLWILFLTQTVLVARGIGRRWTAIRVWLNQHFKFWQFAGVGLIFVLSSTALSREVPVYIAEVCFATFVQSVSLGNVVLLAWAFPQDRLTWVKQIVRFFEKDGESGKGVRRRYLDGFVILAAIWVTTLSALLSYFSYEQHPHIQDEVVYLQHARYLAAGMLTLPPPPVPDAFHVYLMEVEQGSWYAVPPFGWPAFLAIGVLLGAPWLVNPVLAGLNILLAYALARELFDRRIARCVVLLLCVSPWHIFMAMNFMTHTLTLTCALAATLTVAWARRTDNAWWTLIAGGLIGLASLIRPIEGLILAGLLGLWCLGVGGRRLKISSIAALIFGIIPIGAIAFLYNHHLTGNPFANPIMVYTDKHFGVGTNAFGFGPDRGMGWALDPFPGHGPLDAAVNANLNLFSLNIELFGWSVGSLLLISILLFFRLPRGSDFLMFAVIATVFGAHVFYWFSGGPDFGARYWFLMLFPCVALTARSIEFLEGSLRSWLGGLHQARVAVAVFSLCAVSLVNYFPWRAVDKYHHYLRMRPDVRELAKEFDFGKSLVLIRGKGHPDYASAFVYNPLDLQADAPIYAWDRDPATTKKLLEAYKDRAVWIVNGPSITQRGFEVVHSRVSARVLLNEAQ